MWLLAEAKARGLPEREHTRECFRQKTYALKNFIFEGQPFSDPTLMPGAASSHLSNVATGCRQSEGKASPYGVLGWEPQI